MSTFNEDEFTANFAPVLTLSAEEELGDNTGGAVSQDLIEEMYHTAFFVESLDNAGPSEDMNCSEDNEQIMQTIKEASKGVTENTDAEYRR